MNTLIRRTVIFLKTGMCVGLDPDSEGKTETESIWKHLETTEEDTIRKQKKIHYKKLHNLYSSLL